MHHRAGLARALAADGWTAQDAETFMDALVAHARGEADPPARLGAREAACLRYALKLTRSPAAMTREDLDPMRAAGLDDAQILDTNQVAAYFAYVNRVVDGLGVELEPEHERG